MSIRFRTMGLTGLGSALLATGTARDAQATEPGTLDEVDLEHYQGKLVFNVDIGDCAVKVEAQSGSARGADTDD